ncbi:MAG: DUF6326 family protein [Pseudolysinimonas sp.]
MNAPKQLDNSPVPVRAKLAAAWTTLVLLIIYIDYLHLYQPGQIDGLRGGTIFAFDISAPLVTGFFTVIAVPSLMVLLSMTLPARVNRATTLVVAALYAPLSAVNALEVPWDWALYYAVTIGIEMVILAFILRSAWTWPRTPAATALPHSPEVSP